MQHFSHLQSIADEYKVGASIIYWPISLNGREGAFCGKTVYVLEQIAKSSNIFSSNRPFALVNYSREADVEDVFGRSASYGINKFDKKSTIYKASDALLLQENLDNESYNSANNLLHIFIKTHFPKPRLDNKYMYKNIRSSVYSFKNIQMNIAHDADKMYL